MLLQLILRDESFHLSSIRSITNRIPTELHSPITQYLCGFQCQIIPFLWLVEAPRCHDNRNILLDGLVWWQFWHPLYHLAIIYIPHDFHFLTEFRIHQCSKDVKHRIRNRHNNISFLIIWSLIGSCCAMQFIININPNQFFLRLYLIYCIKSRNPLSISDSYIIIYSPFFNTWAYCLPVQTCLISM